MVGEEAPLGRGLLSRIAADARSESVDNSLATSVAEHLRVLLNTRQGDAATVPSFGLVDITDLVHSFPMSVQTLQAVIRSTILDYEPRIKNVVVRHVPEGDPLVLNFEITAQPAEKSEHGFLRFRTQVNASGKISVR